MDYLEDDPDDLDTPDSNDDPDDLDNPDSNDDLDAINNPDSNDDPAAARTPLGKMTNRNIPLTVFGLTFLMWAIGHCSLFSLTSPTI